MASFNASVSVGTTSKVALDDANQPRNQTGQCAPMLSPTLGTLKLEAGNGTSVGTVMTLQCPRRHRAVSGGRVSCVQESSITHWSGGIPECKPLPQHADAGFRLAVLMSIISSAIIIFMSIIFITSCLLKRVRKEERRQMERERMKEEAAFWQHMDHQEVRDTFYSQIGRNNNNNNNNNNNRKPQEHTRHPVHRNLSNSQLLTLNHLQAASRCHQQEYSMDIQPSCPAYEAMPSTSSLNTQTTCVLQPLSTHFSSSLPWSGYDPNVEQPLWKQPIPMSVVTHDSALSGMSGQCLEEPFCKGQHSPGPKSPPIWVINV